MNFCKVEAGRCRWIYQGDRFLLLSKVNGTTLLHQANLQWVPGDTKVVQPVPAPPPFTS